MLHILYFRVRRREHDSLVPKRRISLDVYYFRVPLSFEGQDPRTIERAREMSTHIYLKPQQDSPATRLERESKGVGWKGVASRARGWSSGVDSVHSLYSQTSRPIFFH